MWSVVLALVLPTLILGEDLPVIVDYPDACPTLPNLQKTVDMSDLRREWHDYQHTANVPYKCGSYEHRYNGTYNLKTELKGIMEGEKLYSTTVSWKLSNCTHPRASGICADVYQGYVYLGRFRFLHISKDLYVVHQCDDKGTETMNVAATSRNYDKKLVAELLESNNLTRLTLVDVFTNICPASLNCFAD